MVASIGHLHKLVARNAKLLKYVSILLLLAEAKPPLTHMIEQLGNKQKPVLSRHFKEMQDFSQYPSALAASLFIPSLVFSKPKDAGTRLNHTFVALPQPQDKRHKASSMIAQRTPNLAPRPPSPISPAAHRLQRHFDQI